MTTFSAANLSVHTSESNLTIVIHFRTGAIQADVAETLQMESQFVQEDVLWLERFGNTVHFFARNLSFFSAFKWVNV